MRVGLVEKVEGYDWSSGRSHILGEPDKVLIEDNWLTDEQRRNYVEFVKVRDEKEEDMIR